MRLGEFEQPAPRRQEATEGRAINFAKEVPGAVGAIAVFIGCELAVAVFNVADRFRRPAA